ncbi:MAG: hypothetical protein ACYSWU_29700, partial [Planctomycetota bacterium]
ANNKQPIPVANVEVLLTQLAGTGRKPVARRQIVTPEQAAAAKAAPSQPVEGAPAPAASEEEMGRRPRGRQSKIRSIIGNAIRSSIRDER